MLARAAPRAGTPRARVRRYDSPSASRRWEALAEGPEAEIDALIAREAKADPDLWVIEIETRDGQTLLDQEGLA